MRGGHRLEPVGCHDIGEEKINVSHAQRGVSCDAEIIRDDVHLADIARGDLAQKRKCFDADVWFARGGQGAVQVPCGLAFDSLLRPAISAVESGRQQAGDQRDDGQEGQRRAVPPRHAAGSQTQDVVDAEGQPGPGAYGTHSRNHAGHERDSIEGVVANGERLTFCAEKHLLVRDQPP